MFKKILLITLALLPVIVEAAGCRNCQRGRCRGGICRVR